MPSVQQRPADLTLNKYSLEYPIEELQRATRSFDPACKLGDGTFGAVFHGIQSDGTDVAVKVLDVPEEAGFEEEVRVLSKFRHPNLVILMGFARCGSQRFLVYELLAGGDVYKRLQKSNLGSTPFPWRQRVSAAFDACCGLSHLHNATPKVFHRDIKSPNILLDRNGTAKMADFGLACLSETKAHKVEKAAGTIGYACPLYARRCVVTEGSEVYSFGIVLLELLTASPPAWAVRTPDGAQGYKFLAGEIRGHIDIALALADANAHWPPYVAHPLVELALRCTQREEALRPQFTEVVNALRRLRDAPDAEGPPVARAPEKSAAHSAGAQDGASKPAGPQCESEATLGSFAFGVPRLWSLECVFAKAVEDLAAIPREERTLVHQQEPCLPLSTHFKVGRHVQEDAFRALLDVGARNMVSREHFQIWAQQANSDLVPDGFAIGCVPCSFFLANLSSSWTMVNNAVLDDHHKYVQIHCGDLIALGQKLRTAEGQRYVPFLQFRFDLSGSVLYDVDAARELEVHPQPEVAPRGKATAMAPVAGPALCKCLSDAGGMRPRFTLEIGGAGVNPDVDDSYRVLVHGPEVNSGDEAVGAFPRLVLGSGHATDFWRHLLSSEAFCQMACEHVAFEPICTAQQGRHLAQVAVRRRSYAYPVVVYTKEEAHALDLSDAHVLRHGDVVVIVPEQRCSVWFRFQDLFVASRHCGFAGGA